MRYRDWYFKDWNSEQKIGPSGKTEWVYVYTGRFYLLPESPRKFKLSCLLPMSLYLLFFLFLNFFPSPGGRDTKVGGVGLLQIFPLIFFGLAVRPLIMAGPKMTYRRYRRTIHRLRWGSALAVFILLAQLVLEIRFIVLNGSLFAEAFYLAVLFLDFLLIAVFAFRILRMKFDTADPDPNLPLPSDE